jgi:uncharacterized protein (TIGR00730 family)
MTKTIKSICVYCGSSIGARPGYGAAARALAGELTRHGITLVYGGGNVGIMGVLADSVLAAGGKVIGVIPQALVDKEVAHTGLNDLRIVASMHERKSLMTELADAFIALPGGLGTFEEFCEAATWAQLGFHRKACGILNIDGYYDGLLAMLDHATEEKFIRPEHRRIILSEADPKKLIEKLVGFEMPVFHKWIDRDQR